jgi:predicted SprT family Zn-dependent metalloprotease
VRSLPGLIPPETLERERRGAFAAVRDALGLGGWPEVPVRWNRRLRRAGRALVQGRRGGRLSLAVELSPAYFEVYPEDLRGILIHESVHLGLALLGRDLGHGPEFRRVCLAAGGLLHGRAMPGRVFRYRCPVCRQILDRRRPLAGNRWCAECVEAADPAAGDPFGGERALVLVATGYSGPDPAPIRRDSRSVEPLRYPVGADASPGSPPGEAEGSRRGGRRP